MMLSAGYYTIPDYPRYYQTLQEVQRRMKIAGILKTITFKPGDHFVIKTKYRDVISTDLLREHFPEAVGALVFFVDDLDDIKMINDEDLERIWLLRAEEGE